MKACLPNKSCEKSVLPSFVGKGLVKSKVVNLNISAEPSQSAQVIIGVFT